MSVFAPVAITGQPCTCAGVGASKLRSNQARVSELKTSSAPMQAAYSHPMGPSLRVRGTYLESCNCDAICPCRTIGGVPGGRSTHGTCFGVLTWRIEEGHVDELDVGGLAVALVYSYDDDEEGSPW